jgi:hypothetical protein
MQAAIPRGCVTLRGSEWAGRGGTTAWVTPAFGATGAVRRLPVIDRVCELVVKAVRVLPFWRDSHSGFNWRGHTHHSIR